MENPKYNAEIDIINSFIDIVVLNKTNRPDNQIGKAHQDFLKELDKE